MTNNTKAQFLATNLKLGEHYAGIILGQNGEPDYHLILMPDEAEKVTWDEAKKFAAKTGPRHSRRMQRAALQTSTSSA